MTQRNQATESWTDSRAKAYLDGLEPGRQLEWVVLDDSELYGYVDRAATTPFSGEVEYAWADDDALRVAGIIAFLQRQGGRYVSPKGT